MKNSNSRPARVPITDEEVERLVRQAGARPVATEQAQARVKAIVEARWLEAAAPRTRRLPVWALAAAAAIVLALLTVGILSRQNVPSGGDGLVIARVETRVGSVHLAGKAAPLDVGAGLLAGSVLETDGGGRLLLRTADGYSVRIDVGSAVRLQSTGLLVLDRGAVYVESAPGAAGDREPLIVRTPQGDVVDIGTQYEVRLEGPAVTVQVREGRAELRHDDRSYGADAGIALTLDASGKVSRRSIPLHGPLWDWVLAVSPPLDIEGRPLREFLDWVAHESGRTVVYADVTMARSSGEILLSGTIEGLTPDEALTAVLPTCGLVHRFDDGYVIIDPAPED